MGKLKEFRYPTSIKGVDIKLIVCTESRKNAANLLGTTVFMLVNYGSCKENPSCKLAIDNPNEVFATIDCGEFFDNEELVNRRNGKIFSRRIIDFLVMKDLINRHREKYPTRQDYERSKFENLNITTTVDKEQKAAKQIAENSIYGAYPVDNERFDLIKIQEIIKKYDIKSFNAIDLLKLHKEIGEALKTKNILESLSFIGKVNMFNKLKAEIFEYIKTVVPEKISITKYEATEMYYEINKPNLILPKRDASEKDIPYLINRSTIFDNTKFLKIDDKILTVVFEDSNYVSNSSFRHFWLWTYKIDVVKNILVYASKSKQDYSNH